MKKIFIFFIALYFCVVQNTLADQYQPYVVGQIVEQSISVGKGKYNIPLPQGKFTVIATHKSREKSSNAIQMYDLGLASFKGKVLDKSVNIRFSKQTTTWWNLPKNCKRENLYFYKNYIKGKAFSC